MFTKQNLLITLCIFISISLIVSKLTQKPVCQDCNVIIIAVDALQASHVSSYGYPKKTTPFIDALSQKGFTFKNALSAAPWTVPSYMSIFTGLFPSEHKVVNKFVTFTKDKQEITNLHNVSPSVETLAEILKKNGYKTGGFTGDAGVGASFGYNQGFDVYTDAKTFGPIEDSIKQSLHWLAKEKDHKFFLFVHGYDVHGQHALPENADRSFIPKNYQGPYTGSPDEQRTLREEGLKQNKLDLTSDDIAFWRGVYDAKIHTADQEVGYFLKELDKMNINDKTIVILLSDHGTEFYEHQKFDHGHTLYDELVHVPLIFDIPGFGKGLSTTSQVSTLDIAPTLMDLLGIPTEKNYFSQLRGKSLVPFLQGKNSESTNVFMETDYRDYTHKRAVRTPDGWKYIWTLESNKRELYDLNTDPREQVNLINTNPQKAFTLKNVLLKHLEDMGQNPYKKWSTGCLPVYGDQCKDNL